MKKSLQQRVSAMRPKDFPSLALEVFEYQSSHNLTYKKYLELAFDRIPKPSCWQEIPCAPISLFRTHNLKTGSWKEETYFQSSGTTGETSSTHAVRDLNFYHKLSKRTFEAYYGDLSQYSLFALLPNYLEQGHSGLVSMVDYFMSHTNNDSGYYLSNYEELQKAIEAAFAKTTPVLLWGVTFALLDFISTRKISLPQGSLLIETGGMKGRRKELTRAELHDALSQAIQVGNNKGDLSPILPSSEYGMTELSSQAYLLTDRTFYPAIQMRALAREVTDPWMIRESGKSGVLNLYDLANLNTLSFIQTDDLGTVYKEGNFDVLGRLDHAIVRGCSQLVL